MSNASTEPKTRGKAVTLYFRDPEIWHKVQDSAHELEISASEFVIRALTRTGRGSGTYKVEHDA